MNNPLEYMDRAVVRVAECLIDPEMTEDNIWGWQAVLDAWWDKL